MAILSANHLDPSFEPTGGERIVSDLMAAITKAIGTLDSGWFLKNSGSADIVTGEGVQICGAPTITERVLGMEFEIAPKSFFQTNTLGAEALYSILLRELKSNGGTALDLYGGTGTIGLFLSRRFDHVWSVEVVPDASADGKRNAVRNGISNVEFANQKAEDFLAAWVADKRPAPDCVVVDPPRDGMHESAADVVRSFGAREIGYVSCNPATLARDLSRLCADGAYRVHTVAPMDMFPHTHHVECVVILERAA